VATTLQTYISFCRQLLHDAAGNFWSDTELTDYINQGRSRVAADTGCSRSLQSITLNFPLPQNYASNISFVATQALMGLSSLVLPMNQTWNVN